MVPLFCRGLWGLNEMRVVKPLAEGWRGEGHQCLLRVDPPPAHSPIRVLGILSSPPAPPAPRWGLWVSLLRTEKLFKVVMESRAEPGSGSDHVRRSMTRGPHPTPIPRLVQRPHLKPRPESPGVWVPGVSEAHTLRGAGVCGTLGAPAVGHHDGRALGWAVRLQARGRPPSPRGSRSLPGSSGLAGPWGSPRGRAGRDRPFQEAQRQGRGPCTAGGHRSNHPGCESRGVFVAPLNLSSLFVKWRCCGLFWGPKSGHNKELGVPALGKTLSGSYFNSLLFGWETGPVTTVQPLHITELLAGIS